MKLTHCIIGFFLLIAHDMAFKSV